MVEGKFKGRGRGLMSTLSRYGETKFVAYITMYSRGGQLLRSAGRIWENEVLGGPVY